MFADTKHERMQSEGPPKVVAFDLDETLGSFSELSSLVDSIRMVYGTDVPDEHVFHVMDVFPDFLRPGIVETLTGLTRARARGQCQGIIMYTNNQGPREWAELISRYLDGRVGTKVFDRIIAAYETNGRRVEPGRTSHDKNYEDLLRCTGLPHGTMVCFVDDRYHTLSAHPHTTYIPVEPYVHQPDARTAALRYSQEAVDPNAPVAARMALTQALLARMPRRWKRGFGGGGRTQGRAQTIMLQTALGQFLTPSVR